MTQFVVLSVQDRDSAQANELEDQDEEQRWSTVRRIICQRKLILTSYIMLISRWRKHVSTMRNMKCSSETSVPVMAIKIIIINKYLNNTDFRPKEG